MIRPLFALAFSLILSSCGLFPSSTPTPQTWIGRNINELEARPDFVTDKLEIRKLDDGTEIRHYKNTVSVNIIYGTLSESSCSRLVYVKDKIITNFIAKGNCANRYPNQNPVINNQQNLDSASAQQAAAAASAAAAAEATQQQMMMVPPPMPGF